MRLRPAAATMLLTLAAPASSGAQALSDTFSNVLQTYQFGGCGRPGDPLNNGFPCAGGSAAFGLLRAGGSYGLRFDITADFSNPPPFFSGVRTVRLSQAFSAFTVSTAAARGECSGTYADGRCYARSINFGSVLGSGDALGGLTVISVADISRATATPFSGDPASLRLEVLRIDYDFSDGDGFGSFVVTPSVTLTPEPATVVLTAAGLVLVGAAASRRAVS